MPDILHWRPAGLAIGLQPLLPPATLWVLGLAMLAALALLAWRGGRGVWWRAGAFALLFCWLLGPVLLRERWRPLPRTLLMVTDRSGSMRVGPREAVVDAAQRALEREAAAIPGLQLRRATVDDREHAGTRLLEAVRRAAADIPRDQLAGIVALSDGEAHDAPAEPPSRFPSESGPPIGEMPLHLLIPATGEESDRRLRVLQAPPFGIVGQNVTLRVQVDDLGPAARPGANAILTLRRDGDAPLTRNVVVGEPQDITLPVTAPGAMLLSLDASPLAGEVSTLNNRAVVRITGVRDRLRVLLVSGAPNQGERVWRRLLKADPSVDLVHFTILRPPDKDDTTPLNELALIAFPTRELFQEKIRQFDLIILDGFENRGILPLAYLRNIASFVRGGGGLLLTAGPEFIGRGTLQDTPLSEVLPAHVPEEGGLVEQAFRPMPTALGRRHPVTAGLPQMPPPTEGGAGGGGNTGAGPNGAAANRWGPWFRALRPDRTEGEVLLTGPDRSPLLVLKQQGDGRVAMLLSDQAWLWSRGEDGGGPQSELLRRISHWLMKEPELEENQLSAAILDDRLTVSRRDADGSGAGTVTIVAPDGIRRSLSLAAGNDGAAHGEMALPTDAADGIWEATDGTRHAFAAAVPADPTELADLRATATVLQPLVPRTGGAVAWLGTDPKAPRVPALRLVDAGQTAAGDGWIGLRRTAAHVVTGRDARGLLPAWAVLPLCLLFLLLGWFREGRR
ncbi:VWA domain-containing protein [Rhizosaccharibacter radicis]|uniref:VWA domain-containing protein n=1 Tax=Rhizosaccharibacter radicis TaxID=2782605 RepID=A0ABT1VXF6_9PROT|nr:VWA domain-containing protein [Acetobacteraceae bacterium KSS12]